MLREIALLIAFFVATTASSQALAKKPLPCGPREQIVQILERAGEQRVGLGLTLDGLTVFELWARPNGRTWTFVGTNAVGWTCVITQGLAWLRADEGAPS